MSCVLLMSSSMLPDIPPHKGLRCIMFSLIFSPFFPLPMVIVFPTKISHIAAWKAIGIQDSKIAHQIGCHHTTVARVFAQLKKSNNPYFKNPWPGCPHIMNAHQTQIAAWMLATTEAANATEVVKKLPFDVSVQTVSHCPKEAGLICHIRRSKPYLSLTNIGKHCAWALAHKSWTVKD